MVLAGKKNGGAHFYIDFMGLNSKTPFDGFSMPQVNEILESLYGVSILSTLDLQNGFWQVQMAKLSGGKTIHVSG